MKNLKTYILITFLMGSMLFMCGCGTRLSEFVVNGFSEAISNKAQTNLDIAQMLWQQGFLSEENYNSIKESINQEKERLLGILTAHADDESIDTAAIDTFADTCRAVVVYTGIDGETENTLYGEYYDDAENLCNVELSNEEWTYAVKDPGDTSIDPPYPRQLFIMGNAIYRFRKGKSEPDEGATLPYDSYAGGAKNSSPNWVLLDGEPPMDGSHETTSDAHYVNFIAGRTLKTRLLTSGRVTGSEGDDSEIQDALNDKFKMPIYALDATKIPDGQIDSVLALIHNSVANGGDLPQEFYRYFTEVKDEDGKSVRLMGDDFELIVNSAFDPSRSGEAGFDYIINQDVLIYGGSEPKLWRYNSMPQCSIKFHEFSQEAANQLINTLGLNTGETSDTNISPKYYINVDADGYAAAYLMEYPVSPITSTKEVTINSTRYAHMLFNDTSKNLYVNLMSGGLIVKDIGAYEAVQSSGHIINSNENIKLAFGDGGAVDENNNTSYENAHAISSFFIKGCRPTEITFSRADGSTGTSTVLTPRIILTDYMEAAWAPGITGENLVVFGRKIRFDTSSTYWKTTDEDGNTIKNSVGDYELNDYWLCYPLDDTNNKIAHFIDNESNAVGNLQGLTIYDFCGVTGLLNGEVPAILDDDASDEYRAQWEETWGDWDSNNPWSHYAVARYARPDESSVIVPCAVEATATDVRIDQIRVRKVTSYQISCLFPGKYIGKTDLENNGVNISRFFVVCTTKGMFDSALFSDWINSNSSTASLSWWNNWLSENGYKYTVDVDGLENYLSNNYRYELSQDGVVILDLNTVAKIQEIYDKEENREHARLIRTVFIVLGFIILAYSMILMLCWVLDTHTDLGLSTVNKLTFGHWTAVAYESDLPSNKVNDKSYVDGKHMLIKCLIMIFIAAMLLMVDINRILYLLIDNFGDIAKKLNDIIQGIGH